MHTWTRRAALAITSGPSKGGLFAEHACHRAWGWQACLGREPHVQKAGRGAQPRLCREVLPGPAWAAPHQPSPPEPPWCSEQNTHCSVPASPGPAGGQPTALLCPGRGLLNLPCPSSAVSCPRPGQDVRLPCVSHHVLPRPATRPLHSVADSSKPTLELIWKDSKCCSTPDPALEEFRETRTANRLRERGMSPWQPPHTPDGPGPVRWPPRVCADTHLCTVG